jgi:hypothetical protein
LPATFGHAETETSTFAKPLERGAFGQSAYLKKLVSPLFEVSDFLGLKKVLPPEEEVLPDVVFCFAPNIPTSGDCTV